MFTQAGLDPVCGNPNLMIVMSVSFVFTRFAFCGLAGKCLTPAITLCIARKIGKNIRLGPCQTAFLIVMLTLNMISLSILSYQYAGVFYLLFAVPVLLTFAWHVLRTACTRYMRIVFKRGRPRTGLHELTAHA